MSRNRSMPSRLSFWSLPRYTAGLTLLSLTTINIPSLAQESVAEQVRQLTEAMNRVQAQLQASQRQLEEMRAQLRALQASEGIPAESSAGQTGESDAAKLAAQVDELRERQAVQETQIAVQEQTKVESESKFPVKVSGLVLMNGFVNTRNVDMVCNPDARSTGRRQYGCVDTADDSRPGYARTAPSGRAQPRRPSRGFRWKLGCWRVYERIWSRSGPLAYGSCGSGLGSHRAVLLHG